MHILKSSYHTYNSAIEIYLFAPIIMLIRKLLIALNRVRGLRNYNVLYIRYNPRYKCFSIVITPIISLLGPLSCQAGAHFDIETDRRHWGWWQWWQPPMSADAANMRSSTPASTQIFTHRSLGYSAFHNTYPPPTLPRWVVTRLTPGGRTPAILCLCMFQSD